MDAICPTCAPAYIPLYQIELNQIGPPLRSLP